MKFADRIVRRMDALDDRRRSGDEIKVEFTGQPLLDDLQMQQTETTDTEAKSERGRSFGLVVKARIIEGKPRETFPKIFIFGRVDRKQSAKHDRLRRFESRC